MDGKRFDTFARSLQAASPRRTTLGLLLGGALGLAELANGAAKKKGKKGKKGGKGKKGCSKGQKECRGKCIPADACCKESDCDPCQNLSCLGSPGVCGCLATEIFFNGRCGQFPTCLSAGERREFNGIRCCSGIQHTEGPPEAPFEVCDPGFLSCLTDSDCVDQPCRGFTCEPQSAFC